MKHQSKLTRRILFVAVIVIVILSNSKAQTKPHPNIVIILSDDAGYADFGFTGSKDFKTPHIDKLASEGVLFTNAYVSAAACGPSRAGLLTGRYQQKFGFVYNNVPNEIDKKAGLSNNEMGLPTDIKTIADYLGEHGYKSSIIGKWHQGHGEKFHPLERGFDHFYGFLGGARSYFNMPQLNEETILWRNRETIPEPENYLTDHFADEACRFIEENQQSPFFVFLSFTAVHSPLEAKEKDMELFKNVSPHRRTLAAMTWSMDEAVGKIISKLEQLRLEENTIIIFTNDNGGPSYINADNSPFSGCKATYLEGGIRVPFIIKWKNRFNGGQKFEHPIITLDILPTLIGLVGGNPEEMKKLDGVNLLPFILGHEKSRPHKTLYWNGDGPFYAIRHQDWKLIKMPDRLPELYNLSNDPSEKVNLANEQKALTKDLLKKLFEWDKMNDQPRWQLLKKTEIKLIKYFDEHRK
jgi:arylsulfatase A-like enzyme